MLVPGRRSVDPRIGPIHCTSNSGNRYDVDSPPPISAAAAGAGGFAFQGIKPLQDGKMSGVTVYGLPYCSACFLVAHRGLGCKLRVTLSRGGMTRDAVEWCQGTAVGGGCSTRAWMRRERQRDGSAAGGHENFFGDTYPAILVPQPGADLLPQADRSRPPRTPDARSGEAWVREKVGGVPEEVRARGRFAGSRIG